MFYQYIFTICLKFKHQGRKAETIMYIEEIVSKQFYRKEISILFIKIFINLIELGNS